ncbi:MAG: zinc ribbon domain-containing protein [Pyrinomonadaceae bacterium]
MPEAILEKELCSSCGSDVREGSQFCYNCGEAVGSGPPPPAILKPDGPIDSPPIGPPGTRLRGPSAPERKAPSDSLIKAGPGRPEQRKRPSDVKPGTRPGRNEKIEIEWVEPGRSPSIRLLITAIVLAFFVGLMLLAAVVLK